MLASIFEQQVKKYPGKFAVRTGDGGLTYEELNRYANRVGHQILARCRGNNGEARPKSVGLLFGHGVEMIVGLIGAVKTGLVYVPLDPTYPEKRLAYMLENSGAGLLVTNRENVELAEKIAALSGQTLPILIVEEIAEDTPTNDLEIAIGEDAVAYILYTSGSTGKPKGVYQTHRNIRHFIDCYVEDLAITADDRLTLLSAFCHDAAVMDIYAGLLSGATLYPLNIKSFDITQMAGWLTQEKITIWHSVPTVYRFFIRTLGGQEQFPELRLLVLGGEAMLANDVLMFKKLFPGAVLMNLYGQSESSYNSGQFIAADTPFSKVLLGKSTGETEIIVINETGKKVLPLQVGEIVIASKYVAPGYWQNPEKTNEVFRDHPTKGRLYRTGDLGKYLVDGNIEFMGRKDFQVKIRGYRIEPGEIESQLLEHPGVKETVVLAKKESEDNYYLCAFVVTEEGVGEGELKAFLTASLPEYMVPAYFIKLDRLPLTPNNKIDRLALMEINPEVACTTEYEPPTNETEARLVKIWEEVLRKERIGINDNFFQVGGHSLKATQLIARIYKEFQVEVPLRTIFQNASTVKELAEVINSAQASSYTAIEPVALQESYSLSAAQRRLFILNQLEAGSVSYNMPRALMLEGELDVERLKAAFHKLAARHESLRTAFAFEGSEPMQRILPGVSIELECLEAHEAELLQRVEEFVRPFDLAQAPLFRARLIQVAEERHVLVYDMHHIISDGTTLDLLVQDLVAFYQGQELTALKVQYKDFAAWHNNFLLSDQLKNQEEYWVNIFSGEIPVLNLPTDHPRPPVATSAGDTVKVTVKEDLLARLNSLMAEKGATLYMGLLAAYYILLAKYSGQEDVVVGSLTAGRPHIDLEKIVGMFINTLALRNKPAGEKTFKDFLAEVRENSLKVYENQDYPFEMLVEKIGVKRDLSRNPVFDTVFVLQNTERHEVWVEGLRMAPFEYTNRAARFDITLSAVELGAELQLAFEYRTDLFERATMERFAAHMIHLLEQIVAAPERKLADLGLLLPTERETILETYNATQRDYPRTATYQQLFEAQVERTPEALALIANGQKLTYHELNERANSLAAYLRGKGVGRETVVGLMARRSAELLIGLFGIVKAGGAYLPIDPEYPAGRIHYVLEDSNAQILLTQQDLHEELFHGQEALAGFTGEVIFLENEELYTGSKTNPTLLNEAGDALYLIYTSGSTGLPKGTVLEHRSVVNFVTGMPEVIGAASEKPILSLTTISFDIFLLETLLPLSLGATVVLANEDAQRDPRLAAALLVENGVRMAQLTPSRLQIFLEDHEARQALANLSEICVGGEAFPENLLKRLKEATTAKIYNMYGPTETTVWSTVSNLTAAQTVNIGRPIANTRIYILDTQLQPVPEKVVGELFIAGDGLARGYHERPEMTAERFVRDPFHAEERMYRTGDLARWLPGGMIEYVGRQDQQVKIRGYRIEIGEIESYLDRYPGIKGSAVLALEAEGGFKYLAAYYAGDEEIPVPDLRNYLLQSLPDYMVPGVFVRLAELPLTPNGKIDRKALPEVDDQRPTLTAEYVAPETETEKLIASVWQETLNIERVGLNDNFFDLGGNSLLLVQMFGKLEGMFKGKLAIVDLFAYPTIARLTQFIESKGSDGHKRAAEAEAHWAKELGAAYQLLTLPAAYYANDFLHSAGTSYQFRLKAQVTQILREIAAEISLDVQDILTALYVYLFSEMGGTPDVLVEVGFKSQADRIFPIRVNLAEFSDMLELFKLVGAKYTQAEEFVDYQIPSIRSNARPENIIPLFTRGNGHPKSNAVIFKFDDGGEEVILYCNYDETRLSGDKIEELINAYVSLVEMLVQEYAKNGA